MSNAETLIRVQEYDKRDSINKLYHDTTNRKPTRRIQSHGNGLVNAFVVRTRRAVVAAPPGIEVRDALALCRVLARLFALFNVRQFARRCFNVFLSGTSVALDLGADLHPYALVLRNACNRREIRGCRNRYHVC